MEEAIRRFLRSRLALQATRRLKDGTSVCIVVDGKEYYYMRVGSRNKLVNGKPRQVDMYFWIRPFTLKKILDKAAERGTTIAQFGLTVLRYVLAHGKRDRIFFRMDVSVYTLIRKGYFSVLRAAGPDVRIFLREHGFDSLKSIKEFLQRIRR